MSRTRVGVSGWTYDKWKGVFYPEDLPRKGALPYVARRFNIVEVNGTFYSLQKPDTFRSWYEQTPDDFVFAVKGSRYITHVLRLGDAETALANFLAQGVLRLEEKLGPILWQLPASSRWDEERLAGFLELLPGDTEAAAGLASRHDEKVEGRAWTEVEGRHRMRHVLEVRHDSWFRPEFVRLLRDAGVGLVFSHSAKWPYTEELTAGFVYMRLHGAPDTYESRYEDEAIERWADRIERWRAGQEPDDPVRITDREPPRRKGRDVYVFFDNDALGHAPHDALRLAARVGVDPERPDE